MRDCFILLKSDAGSPAVSSAGRTIILLRWGNLSEHIEYTLRSWAWPCPHLSRLGLACDQINGCVWRLEQSSDCLRQYYRYGGRQDYQSSGCLRRCCSPGSMPVEAVLPSRNLSLLLCPHQTSHCCPALSKPLTSVLPSPNLSLLQSPHQTKPCCCRETISNNNQIPRVWVSMWKQSQKLCPCRREKTEAGKLCVHQESLVRDHNTKPVLISCASINQTGQPR